MSYAKMGKKGLSTVISSLLLIILAVAIASIIFISYKNIVEKEMIKTEFENKCGEIEISATMAETGINIINIGNGDVEGIAIKRTDDVAEYVTFENVLKPGEIILVNFTGDSIIPIFKNNKEHYICRDRSFNIA